MNFFSRKLAVLSQIGSPANMLYLKNYCHNLIKNEINDTLKNPISNLFSDLGKIWEYSLGLYSKYIFPAMRKSEKSIKSNIQKSQNFLNWEKLGNGKKASDKHSKIAILNLWKNLEKLCPNLSFNAENKIGNLHKM